MLKHVLPVRRAVLEAAEELHELRMQPVNVELEARLLADLADLLEELFPRLLDDLLDAAGMNAAVLDELLEGEPGDLAPDRIETRENDRLGRVVDDHVDAGRVLERPDVAPLAADDTPFHLIARKVHDRYGRFDDVIGRAPLDRERQYLAALLDGITLRLFADIPYLFCRLVSSPRSRDSR